MSMPVSYCQFVKALADTEYFKKFHPIMHRNLQQGHFTVMQCRCSPRCKELSTEEASDLIVRFKSPLDEEGEPR